MSPSFPLTKASKLTTTGPITGTTRGDDSRAPVSVVVTTYQSVATVGRALDSVAAQTISALETFVCDDGSTDGTPAEAAKHEHAEVIELFHSGMVAVSRNAGVARASGEWIAFLDADDEWMPEHLELFVDVLRSHPARAFDLFGGNAVRVRAGKAEQFFSAPKLPARGFVTDQDLVRVRPIITSSAVARRDRILAVGGFPEDAESVSAEDFHLWYRMSGAGAVYFDPRVHVRYHESPEGLTKSHGGWRARSAAIHVLRRLLEDEARPSARKLLREAIVTDELTRAVEFVRRRHPLRSAGAVGRAAGVGVGPFTAVAGKALRRRLGRSR